MSCPPATPFRLVLHPAFLVPSSSSGIPRSSSRALLHRLPLDRRAAVFTRFFTDILDTIPSTLHAHIHDALSRLQPRPFQPPPPGPGALVRVYIYARSSHHGMKSALLQLQRVAEAAERCGFVVPLANQRVEAGVATGEELLPVLESLLVDICTSPEPAVLWVESVERLGQRTQAEAVGVTGAYTAADGVTERLLAAPCGVRLTALDEELDTAEVSCPHSHHAHSHACSSSVFH